MPYKDLRDWLKAVEAKGELKHIEGANADLEMSTIAEIIQKVGKQPKPAILFDSIQGFPKGFRTLFGMMASTWRIAVALGLPEDQVDRKSLAHNWINKSKSLRYIPPRLVTSSTWENVDEGENVNLLKFPAPRFHELDNSHPYIGTACLVIQKDPEKGWVNLGTYRIMLADRNRLALHITEGKHGQRIMHEKYFAKGMAMPIAIAIGTSPTLYHVGGVRIPFGTSEYDYAGGLLGEPIDIVKGPLTGLLLPANAEIIIEGECQPGDMVDEGPFGEARGYYANLGLSPVSEPAIQVKAVYYRNNPILTCEQPTIPPHGYTLPVAMIHSAEIQEILQGAGIPGVKGVWCHEEGAGSLFNVISIEQQYSGHSREVGLIASQLSRVGRYTVIVDDDVDPADLSQVIWAITTRTTPDKSIQILAHCRSDSSDPAIPVAEKRKYKVAPKPLYSSRVIIDACREFADKGEWYPVVRVSSELWTKVFNKWKSRISDVI